MAFVSTFSQFCLFFTFLISSSIAQTTSFTPKALVLPVTKDSATGQYTTQLSQRTPLFAIKLTVDLGGQYLWVDCDQNFTSSTFRPAECNSEVCNLAEYRVCGGGFCSLYPYNPITNTATIGQLAQDVVSLQSTDGSNPGSIVIAQRVLFTCGSTSLLEGLANGVKGMAGLGRGPIGLASQLSSAFSFSRKFAICLGEMGVIFFGDGPYNFLPDNNVSQSLIYTPLFINPISAPGSFFPREKSIEYFIGVKNIKIDEEPVSINSTLLNFFDKEGNGGTKISTINPYTMMERSIYKAFTSAFAKALSGVPRVSPFAPFDVCFNSSHLGVTRVGPAVPTIDFVLQSPTDYWRIFGGNAMVQVKEDVLCLGFVDGGLNPGASIVIGIHQIENNLLEFDLARSRLGFTSTLYFQRTTCSNFNLTSNA
ncbi:hypothetical protein ACH5RR_033467 [Cinchona calisaya]|uniref:Peptidase A1 domain-containing protein n=1 Tax=Cinchona calisaya TaxID=153742 RepID=A0ABD2YL20_9GENT